MLSDISSRLTQAIEKKRLKTKTEQDFNQVKKELAEKSSRVDDLEQELKKEQVDVEKLEGFSLTGLFYSVLGSRDQQVEKERQELLAAQLKYQQAKRQVDALREDQANLGQKLSGLRGIEEEYSGLLAEKESLLRQANSPDAADLVRISEQIAERNAEKQEIDEAVAAAEAVLAGLDQVIESLESAENWGTWDMLGGGFLSTAIKHSRIDDARNAVQEVQARMSRFNRELADVQRSVNLEIEISGLDVFADHFFDGLIVDWIVQSKINDSLERARQARDKVAQAAEDLGKLKAGILSQAERLKAQRAALIEQS